MSIDVGPPDRITVLWSCQRALGKCITPNMRRIYVGWSDYLINIYFIFDGEISDEDRDEASCVSCEVSADFIDECWCESTCLQIDSPQLIHSMGQACVYARKEAGLELEELQEPFLSYLGEDYQKIEKKSVARRLAVLLSCQRALLGVITPRLREVLVRWTEDKIMLQFIFDGEILQSDEDDAKLVADRIMRDFDCNSQVETHYLQVDFPNRYEEGTEADVCVYFRKEVYHNSND